MAWKTLFAFAFLLFIIISLSAYYLLPLGGERIFKLESYNESSFVSYTNNSLQFYSNMRYSSQEITYRIFECPPQKSTALNDAIALLEDRTLLVFIPVESKEELTMTCSSESRNNEDGFFVAGEGGPTNITAAGRFNVIHNGKVTLLRESKCPQPNIGLHEILHALGFEHSADERSIMYPVSNCDQVLTSDIINAINNLYSVPSRPDLAFRNVSANITGRYLNIDLSVMNQGLRDAGDFKIIVSSNGRSIETIEMDALAIGYGRSVSITNIRVFSSSIDSLDFNISADYTELEKNNNELQLFFSP